MALPTLITSYQVLSPASDTTSLVTPSFTPSNGEVIIVKAASETFTVPTIGSASGGGQTFTSRVDNASANHSPVRLFSAVVSGSPGSMEVTVQFLINDGWHSMVVERWSGAQLAGSPAVVSAISSGAPSATINTVANDSIVTWVSADWNAVAPGTPAYRSGAVQDGMHDKSGTVSYVAYYAYQDAVSSGSQTIGLTAPGAQEASFAGIEVQGIITTTPTVTTQAVTDIAATTATGNGTVVSDGGDTITERGVCWSTSLNPTTSDSKATTSGTTGAFSASITGLTSGTLYHVRAYAINANGTSYGGNVTFLHYPVNLSWIHA